MVDSQSAETPLTILKSNPRSCKYAASPGANATGKLHYVIIPVDPHTTGRHYHSYYSDKETAWGNNALFSPVALLCVGLVKEGYSKCEIY